MADNNVELKNSAASSRAAKSSRSMRRRHAGKVSHIRATATKARSKRRNGWAALDRTYNWAAEAGRGLPVRAGRLSMPNSQALHDFAEERPLLFGVLGLGLGVIIGAILPFPAKTHSRTTRG